uniref:Uncharacterized protein n=1 Tax=Neolamprologus brichardi TaxID=32507 RepID=A0A3Q4GYY6_NEOBR
LLFTSLLYEIMQQDIRPLLAVDIIEQLHRQFASLSGGRGKDGAPIITFPEYSGFSEVPEEDFLNVVTYLTSIPRYVYSHTIKTNNEKDHNNKIPFDSKLSPQDHI